ncbi:hypothetical protein [Maridesulfovibrio sp.]|uniref:hypothetical protein n=1 Tax=Maridesulfovibrio sp. TaxID=2795000 RepID=UPI0029CAAA14|nr:hypothetical protein [Maridesulfovibrio sp.]
MKKKIFIGTNNIGNNIFALAQGFRELGFEVGTASTIANHKLYGSGFDFVLDSFQQEFRNNPDPEVYLKNLSGNDRRVLDFDIYISIASTSLLPGMLDFPILKKMGKTIISFPCGSDIRHNQSAKIFNAHFGHGYPKELLTNERNLSKEILPLALKSTYVDTFSKKMYNIRMAECYADLILSAPCSNTLGIRPYNSTFIPFDDKKTTPKICGRDKPVVFHAPTSRYAKGTNLILKTLDQLKSEGVPFDIIIAENLPNEEILKSLTECDVVIDQIACGKNGLLNLEAMSSGCTVLGPNDEYSKPIPFNILPIIRITKNNLYGTLKKILTDRQLRIKTAEEGLRYMNRGLHTPKNVARYILKSLTNASQGACDYYPTFFFEHAYIPDGEIIPEALFAMTKSILQEYGTSEDILQGDTLTKYFGKHLTESEMSNIPVWSKPFRKKCVWGWWSDIHTGKNDRYINSTNNE